MKFFIALILWCLLFVFCWPLALLVLVALPVLWLLSIPLRIVFFVLESVLSLLRAIFFLPARLLTLGAR